MRPREQTQGCVSLVRTQEASWIMRTRVFYTSTACTSHQSPSKNQGGTQKRHGNHFGSHYYGHSYYGACLALLNSRPRKAKENSAWNFSKAIGPTHCHGRRYLAQGLMHGPYSALSQHRLMQVRGTHVYQHQLKHGSMHSNTCNMPIKAGSYKHPPLQGSCGLQ